MEFFQSAPELGNQYDDDRVLKNYLARILPQDIFNEVEKDLRRFGGRVIDDILKMAFEAERVEPTHIPYDAWGKRIDFIQTSKAWNELDEVSAEEGIVALGYQRRHGEFSRLHQFAKLYLFHPSSAIYSCPLAMTDGAARVIELHGNDEMKNRAYKHLISTDPKEFWTSGQWMTERSGGSDVSGTSTIAKFENGQWQLHGVKWFTSATTSQMAMTLARIDGDDSGKLSLFYVELRNEKGDLQNIQVNRLKNKLGTKALPTAELTLMGTPAALVGEKGKGVKTISTLFNITRIYNACCAVGYMRRGIALATSYATKREAFGKLLKDHSLHVETLAQLQVQFEASFHLTFHAVRLLGLEETGKASQTETSSLRLLIPLVKLFTAKECVGVCSEVLESFGGAGYVEDTHLPEILRNAQVLAIWEGTTNVLSLDALRAIKKEAAGVAFIQDMEQRLSKLNSSEFVDLKERVKSAIDDLSSMLNSIDALDEEDLNSSARNFAMGLARTYAATLLLEQAAHDKGKALIVARRWIALGLYNKINITHQWRKESTELLF